MLPNQVLVALNLIANQIVGDPEGLDPLLCFVTSAFDFAELVQSECLFFLDVAFQSGRVQHVNALLGQLGIVEASSTAHAPQAVVQLLD